MVDLKIELPEGFLNEEVRCDYTVTRQMKEVWAVELDLLSELLRVCDKYSIRIFADAGTLLGAVRHKGFIPWDDDIDMMMFREDYEKLCEVAPNEFKHPYFFQTEYTDPGSLRGHAQLRNSDTTGILTSEYPYKFSFNQGIFIDIFVIDKIIDNEKTFARQQFKIMCYRALCNRFARVSTRYCSQEAHSGGVRSCVKRICYLLGKNLFMKLEVLTYRRFEAECKRYNDLPLDKIALISYKINYKHLMKEDFASILYMPFEWMMIPVCKGYDSVLKNGYGDYMECIKGSSDHGGVIFDTNRSYRELL